MKKFDEDRHFGGDSFSSSLSKEEKEDLLLSLKKKEEEANEAMLELEEVKKVSNMKKDFGNLVSSSFFDLDADAQLPRY
ncbi:MAG: hypothetical protein UR25_C0001G0117 [Candidatus Nomurabacteria bacterium GW2011_GWE1_32_28]|uniref:Uncharacterized protein n=1 Tax=Candidatus Nomurabacteria bacterium GW2011_GWF1_31_48 TaxID=1618767 RepID=A0A0F9YW51_9BACT|nr:MAG: hypothetical protein UR10_C0001G0070 [Candidatus Nomurabacteria bacterium GW2011_GWF2_30_133]KKP28948.1 MAG: hypothetical protein UR18_C0001G0069 [Candidatus Nomurabacteria bacterium GW2011_GWE2_31_40]KKP30686.1 MAG: hypothetical protein UR19_C0001G0070 [Candidatus Nomurabacteria bacterium GW2011_GWF1_31_48]KKP35204.1 MAG: hypothetical protein UR25_C0001G0117 [Candidatus Nomurabacteria bacterium GW2011_GWE1_32_28]HAS80514.1 hypothetical protein [Candidatus Nomurabacteria bacterium]